MALIRNSLFALLLLLYLAYAETESDSARGEINVTFWRLMEKFVYPGETVSFRSEVYNDGVKYATLLKWRTPLDNHESRPLSDIFKVQYTPCDVWRMESHQWCETSKEPEELVYMGIRTKKTNPARSSYANLKPGSVTHNNIDLTELYDFSRFGHYTIELDTNMIDVVKHWNTDHRINSRVFANFTTTLEPIQSNKIIFEVYDNKGMARRDPTRPQEQPKEVPSYTYETSPRIPVHDTKYPATWKVQELKIAESCNEKRETIQRVVSELLEQIEKVSKLPRETIEKYLKKWFGGEEDFELVDKRLRAIANLLTDPELSTQFSLNCAGRSEPICGKDSLSFSSARFNQISLCVKFFDEPEEQYNTPTGILLHELSHLLFNLRDYVETDKQCESIPVEKRRVNANNFQFFFEDLVRETRPSPKKERTEF